MEIKTTQFPLKVGSVDGTDAPSPDVASSGFSCCTTEVARSVLVSGMIKEYLGLNGTYVKLDDVIEFIQSGKYFSGEAVSVALLAKFGETGTANASDSPASSSPT